VIEIKLKCSWKEHLVNGSYLNYGEKKLSDNELYFVRHGLTNANRDGLMCGRKWDIELNEEGHEQARCSAVRSIQYNIQYLFVSPLKRALQTAEYFSSALVIPLTIRKDLAEWDLGEWDRIPSHSVEEAFLRNEDPPKGEKFVDFRKRIRKEISDIKMYPNSLIISHGGVWRQISDIYLMDYNRAENCQINKVIIPANL